MWIVDTNVKYVGTGSYLMFIDLEDIKVIM